MFSKYLQSLKMFQSGRWTPELSRDLTELANTSKSPLVQNLHLKHRLATTDSFNTLSEKAISDSESLAKTTLWTPFQSNYANTLATAITIEKSWHVHELLLQAILKGKLEKFKHSPAVLAFMDSRGTDQDCFKRIKDNTDHSPSSASAFLNRIKPLHVYLSTKSVKTVSVVGNSPDILEKEHGHYIDAADCVIRFNHTSTLRNHKKHIGEKYDIWVASPGYQFQNTLGEKPNHICLSGYYPYERTSKYWHKLEKYFEAEYLKFPSGIWSDLTRQLQAPPSAGLQCLTALSKSSLIINAYGFTLNRKNEHNEDRNHYADSEKRSARHNWDIESELLKNLSDNRVNFF